VFIAKGAILFLNWLISYDLLIKESVNDDFDSTVIAWAVFLEAD
jgi:hypothetical protein